MADIVERLRDSLCCRDWCDRPQRDQDSICRLSLLRKEAAAEIERLRAALQYAVERFAAAQLHDDAEACRRMLNEQKGDQG